MKERPLIFSGSMVRAVMEWRKTQTRRLVGDLRVVPRRDVHSDMPSVVFGATGTLARSMDDAIRSVSIGAGHRYRANMNPHGAVFAELGDKGRLGLKPGEFDFVCPYADGRTYIDEGRWRIDVAAGPRLWVRETWRTGKGIDDWDAKKIAAEALEAGYRKPWAPIRYEADGATDNEDTLRHSFGGGWGKARSPLHMPRWASRLLLEVTEVRVQRLQDITAADAMAEGARRFDDIPGPSPYKNGNRWSMFDPPSTEHCLGSPQMAFANAWDAINGKRAPWESNPWVWAITFRRLP